MGIQCSCLDASSQPVYEQPGESKLMSGDAIGYNSEGSIGTTVASKTHIDVSLFGVQSATAQELRDEEDTDSSTKASEPESPSPVRAVFRSERMATAPAGALAARINRGRYASTRSSPELRRTRSLDSNFCTKESQADLCQVSEDLLTMRMLIAAAQGKLDILTRLLDAGVDVNSRDYDDRTALHVAVAQGRLDAVKLLVSRGADVECKDRWGRTPRDDLNRISDSAVREATFEALFEPMLVDADTDWCRQSSKSSLASAEQIQQHLWAAAAAGCKSVESFLNQGADPNAQDARGWTAMHVAAAYGHVAVVQLLLAKNGDPNVVDHAGEKPVAVAFANKHVHVVELLGGFDKAEQEKVYLRCASQEEGWSIEQSEVAFGKLLSRTNKSHVHMAEWNGLEVVAKTVKPPNVVSQERTTSAMDSKEYEELLHEIRILSTLRHPDLVLFLGACLDAKPYYIISEYMAAGDLDTYYTLESQRLGRIYKPKWSQLMRWMSAIARALCFLHARKCPIIHRDLKPLNIFLTKQLDAKVADFGISKIVSFEDMRKAVDGKYMSGGVGTWRYMAPEIVRYEQYTESVDIYSFALIMYFMATGIPPFMEEFGPNAELVLKDYLKGNEPRPVLHKSLGAPLLRRLMRECWHPIPSKRPSAKSCVDVLIEIGSTRQSYMNSGLEQVKRLSRTLRKMSHSWRA